MNSITMKLRSLPPPATLLFCLVVSLPFLVGCSKARYCCADNVPVQIHGTRAVLNPAADWGGKTPLQDPWVIEALNAFFAEHAAEMGLPDDISVHNHPDGASLLYTWTNTYGLPEMMQQTARQAVWFNILSLNGRLAIAQERDWGFIATPAFARDHRENRAITILHEFWHQYSQIKYCGVTRYWFAYAGQFLANGYFNMPLEKEAYAASDRFEKFIEARYNVIFKKRSGGKRCGRCRGGEGTF